MSWARTRPYFSDSVIERLAREELANLNLLPPTPRPIRIDRFIEKRFGPCMEFEDLPEGVLGLTRFTNAGVDAIVISRTLLNDSDDVVRRRLNTTLAHEAGHGLLHAQLFKGEAFDQSLFDGDADVVPERILCRDPGRGRYEGRWWELQANKMMAALLLPASLVANCVEAYLQGGGLTGPSQLAVGNRAEAERRVSTVFDVNPIASKYRLEALFPPSDCEQLTL